LFRGFGVQWPAFRAPPCPQAVFLHDEVAGTLEVPDEPLVWNFQVRSGFLAWRRDRHEARGFARQPVVFEAKPMMQDFIFAQDVILDPDTAKILAVVRNGEIWREGTRIAVLIGAQMYDLNGNLLGKLAAGAGSVPISFKNLVEGTSAHAERALVT
jgi:hypothetical protein